MLQKVQTPKIVSVKEARCRRVHMVQFHLHYRGFNSQSGDMPRLQVWSLVGACARGNQSMFLSCMDAPLPLSLPPCTSL